MAERRLIRRYLVGGMVQGVGFRYYVRRVAQRLGVSGWVRNLPDGRVETVASGEPIQLAAFEHELRRGPSMANVTSLRAFEVSDQPEVLTGFEIRG